MTDIENSASLSDVNIVDGTKENLKKTWENSYLTGDGQQLRQYSLSSSSSILIPTCVDVNSCFEYRFSIKDFNLPSNPGEQGLYIENIVVKIQDVFTQITSHDCIKDGLFYFYSPYSAVVSQDQDGIETEEQIFNYNGVDTKRKFISTNRMIKRQDSPLYVCTSNLKVEKTMNLTQDKNSYKLLIISNKYDEEGNFLEKIITPSVSITFEELQQCLTFNDIPKRGKICQDVIVCDILIFMMKTVNLSTETYFKDLKELPHTRHDKTVPRGWLSLEEKIERYGKKGCILDKYVANPTKGNYITLPNDLYLYVDMQTACNEILAIARPDSLVFEDTRGIIGGFRAQYAFGEKMASITAHF